MILGEKLMDWPDLKYKAYILMLVILPLVGTVMAGALVWQKYVFAQDLWLLGSLYLLIGLGVTIGYHRMLTHRSFEARPWLKGLLLILGSMAFEGSPLSWTATHIKHHAHSDNDDDPHSPLHGFWHAHMGWLFGKNNFADPAKYVPHLLRDPMVVTISRYTPFWMTFSLVLPFFIGGWTGLLWGGAVRIFLLTHTTWSVNSVCHTFGRRPFPTLDRSHNNWWVGVLGFGEGWHNNHHAFPTSAFHGLKWWQFDLSGWLIWLGERVGWVRRVRRVPEAVQQNYQERIRQATKADSLASK
jgi:stearoyl-CoA desaturase (delta-9 desaturase)